MIRYYTYFMYPTSYGFGEKYIYSKLGICYPSTVVKSRSFGISESWASSPILFRTDLNKYPNLCVSQSAHYKVGQLQNYGHLAGNIYQWLRLVPGTTVLNIRELLCFSRG